MKRKKEAKCVGERSLGRGLDWLDKLVVHKNRVDQSDETSCCNGSGFLLNCRQTDQRAVSNT